MATRAPERLDLADLPDFLTVPQTAAFLNVSRSTCWKLVAAGAIPSVRLTSRATIRVPRDELMAWLRSRTQKIASGAA